MFMPRRLVVWLTLLGLVLCVVACAEKSEDPLADQPFYGDGSHDNSEVVARVNGYEITAKDLNIAYEELVPRLKKRYEGEEGRQLLLKKMVDDLLLAQAALEQNLQDVPEVGRTIISTRRLALVEAMRNLAIPEGRQPTEADIEAFYKDNRQQFMQQPTILARHIECLTLERAQEAYQQLKDNHQSHQFMKVAGNYSVNKQTLQNNAEVGWYNPTGVIPMVPNSKMFIAKTVDLDEGLHAPIQVADRWHVVEILKKKPGRFMTFNEVRSQALNAMLPAWNDNLVKEFLLQAREGKTVELLGEYAPGGGVSPEALMKRAAVLPDPDARIDYYRLIYTDFPQSDRADDALFMSAMVCIDTYADRRMAQRYLDKLLAEYPDSDLRDDASFLRENLYNPEGMVPQNLQQPQSP
ncbi:hypothetical protein CSA17_05685 [bacterium DOLJORAL78_65_58]|nr:MAG: hypothetical protein CSB20_12915 [bacterium DOLZORAL124_64_63]PIE75777.1 MAG: hypothetical protein CSA17_05685 [bacterium DOLJORAL78_65_58]